MEIDVSKLGTAPSNKVQRLFVTVYLTDRPDQNGFKGFAKSISSFDKEGQFDVLPMHENFVSDLNKELLVINEKGESINYTVKSGVLEVSNNVARIFLKT